MKTNKDTDLREALRRRYANTPSLPTDFTERLRERMDTKPAASHRRHWWGWMSAAAACLLIAIGVGVYYEFNKAPHSIAKLSAPDNKTECTQLSNRGAPIRQSGRTNQAIGAHQSSNRARSTEISDTLGNGIWRSERNVAIAIQMLSECEETILREEQEMRNHIIQATFNATPQPANAVLVTNEAGDYEVIETKAIIEI